MPTQANRLKFEQQLTQLKQARHNAEITIDEYIKQAGGLRFDDEIAGQTWWLDPESETWYVAPIGTANFEEYVPPTEAQPTSDETEPPQPEPAPEPEDEPEMGFAPPPETQFESQPEPAPSKTVTPIPISMFLVGAGIIIVIAILSVIGGFWLFSGNKQTPTPTTVAGQTTPTAVVTVSSSETPTATPSPTSIPAATLTPTLSPSETPSPTSLPPLTPIPTLFATNTPTLTLTDTPLPVTDTPIPVFTSTPTSALSGKLAYPEYDNNLESFKIKVVDIATGQIISEVPRSSQPALSIDGTKLAYTSWAGDKIGLYSVSLVDGIQNTLSDKVEAQRPQWNFNGRDKVFEYKKESQEDVRFSDETGLAGIQMGRTPTWLPDGRIALFAGQGGQYGLAVVKPDGTELKFLTNNTEDVAPAVSPDGQWVAYTSADDVWLISINGGKPTHLTTASGREGIPTWSPDGQWIAFAAEIDGQWSVQVIHPNGTGQQKLLDIPGGLGGTVTSEAYRYQGWLHESISWSK